MHEAGLISIYDVIYSKYLVLFCVIKWKKLHSLFFFCCFVPIHKILFILLTLNKDLEPSKNMNQNLFYLIHDVIYLNNKNDGI